jgi:cardiolipin synthase
MLWYSLHQLLPTAVRGASVFFGVVSLALIPLVLVRRKEPSSTIAWILTLVFLPALGAILFLLFGRDRVRLPAKRKREMDALVRADLDASSAEPPDLDSNADFLPQASPLERALFRVGAHLTHTGATSGNAVEVLAKGNTAYDRIGAAIDAASHHVHAQYYLIRDDATGRWFRERLVAAAKRGVTVRLLLDGYGCFTLREPWKHPLRKAGVHVHEFLPMRSALLQPINLRNHRKIVVVDGQIGFTGGFNIGDEYRGHMRGVGEWRDVHLRIEGRAAQDLQRVFFQDWAFATGERIGATGYFPKSVPDRGDATIAIVTSGPDTRNEAIHSLFFGAIAGAEREVLVTTPYFVPTEALLTAMEVAAMRGVDLKLLLPAHSNHSVTFHAGRSFYSQLLEAGVDVLEYQPGIVHAKTLVADGKVALVGSANMDLRSFRLNFEVHALVHDATTAKTIGDAFRAEAADSRSVGLAAWHGRPWGLRVKEGMSRMVSPLL